MSQFDLTPCFDEEDFCHWFFPRPGIVDCFVVEKDGVITGKWMNYEYKLVKLLNAYCYFIIIGYHHVIFKISCWWRSNLTVTNKKNIILSVGNWKTRRKQQIIKRWFHLDLVSYYTLPSTVMHHPVHKSLKAAYSFYNASTSTPWTQLMNDALVTAKKAGFDVFNALDLMENKTFLENLKFGIGDGNLHYYIYNWRCPNMPSQHVGLVLQWFVFLLPCGSTALGKILRKLYFSTALKQKNKKNLK